MKSICLIAIALVFASGCGGAAGGETTVSLMATGGSAASAGAAAADSVALVRTAGSAGSDEVAGGAGGAISAAGAPSGGSDVSEAGAPAGGAVSIGGTGGAIAIGGAPSGGSPAMGGATAVDPLAPFPAPGCPDYTEYRIPKGKSLLITGDFTNVLATSASCDVSVVPLKSTDKEICNAAANVAQCDCPVSFPGCNKNCDGEYLLVGVKRWANPADCNDGVCRLNVELVDGEWTCSQGAPKKSAS